MQRDSAYIFGFSVLLTAIIVGGAYYLSVVKPMDDKVIQSSSPNASPALQPQPLGSPAPTTGRSDQIIKCIDPEIGEFYTNAGDCQSADLQNRLSSAQDVQKVDYISPGANEVRKNLRTATKSKSSSKPSLRRVAHSVPDNLSVSCKWAVGRALEIERLLSAADDPAKSTWRENYCEWVNEARGHDCRVGSDIFYYDHLCGYRN